MKILHTSDWHLGISLHNFSLLDDQRFFLEGLYKIIEHEKIDAVVLSGDVFDSSVSSAQAIELYNGALTKICMELCVPLLIIAGNHDGAARLSCARELLKGSGLHIEGRLRRNIEPVIIGSAAFYLIPYFNTDEARALFPELEIKSAEQGMAAVCDEIRKSMNEKLCNIAVAHAFVSGAALSESDRSAVIGTASMVSADVFKGFDYVALGHLHRAQQIKNTRYSGSALKYSASEAKTDKSVTVFDTETAEIREIITNPMREVRVIRGELDGLLQNAEFSEDYVKLEVTDKFVTLDTIGALRNFYPNMFAVLGKTTAEGAAAEISVEQIKAMTSSQLLTRFFEDSFQYTPTEKQITMFEEAMLSAKTEGAEQ